MHENLVSNRLQYASLIVMYKNIVKNILLDYHLVIFITIVKDILHFTMCIT